MSAVDPEPQKLKVGIQPVPAPLWGCNLRKLLSKSRWRKYREELISDRGSICETCGVSVQKRIQLHEDWDYSDSTNPAVAKLTGVKLVCWHCHKCEHFGVVGRLIAEGRLSEQAREDTIEHFCRVNAVDYDYFDQHLHDAMDLWSRRSRMAWIVDLGEYRSWFPKGRLQYYFDPDGNPIKWLAFTDQDEEQIDAFLHDLNQLSRFYGIWIGQENRSRNLTLHMHVRGEDNGKYLGQIRKPLFDLGHPDAPAYTHKLQWTADPVEPKPFSTRERAVYSSTGYEIKRLG